MRQSNDEKGDLPSNPLSGMHEYRVVVVVVFLHFTVVNFVQYFIETRTTLTQQT